MDLDELRAVQESERSTDSLQSLRDSFYRDVAEYINGLREERARAAERADDPFGSEEVRHLTDEIETAQEVAEAIYDRRLGKVVKRASLAAAGMPTDEEGLTDEEAALFADVVERIETRRDGVLSAFAGETELPTDAGVSDGAPDDEHGAPVDELDDAGPANVTSTGGGEPDERADPDPSARTPAAGATPPESGGDPATGADTAFDASEAMGGEEGDRSGGVGDRPGDRDDRSSGAEDRERADPADPTPDGGRLAGERTTVRITRDVGEIMGVDEHVYELAGGDVATLPRANAEPLLERDAADRIE